jgi:hypothetical protein
MKKRNPPARVRSSELVRRLDVATKALVQLSNSKDEYSQRYVRGVACNALIEIGADYWNDHVRDA